MPSRLAELRRERATGNDWSDPGEDEGYGGDEVTGQFSQSSRRPRIFELGTRRGIHLLGKRTGLDVISCDDRDGFLIDTQTMERLRRLGGGSGGRKQRDDDRMWHGWYLTSTRRLLVGVAFSRQI